jgi:hypothetical protein
VFGWCLSQAKRKKKKKRKKNNPTNWVHDMQSRKKTARTICRAEKKTRKNHRVSVSSAQKPEKREKVKDESNVV